VKKYIQYAKSRIKPVLTKGAADHIISTYSALRNDELTGNQRRTSPMTARTLETLIRLSTAHAKSRLSNRVEEKDAKAAESILRFALFKEVVEDERRKRRKTTNLPESDSDSSDSDSDGEFTQQRRRVTSTASGVRTTRRRAAGRARSSPDTHGGDDDEEGPDGLYSASPRGARTTASSSRNARSQGQTQTDSQMSMASSQPASQLLQTQTDDNTQSQPTVDPVAAALAAAESMPRPPAGRVTAFRRALGPLMLSALFASNGDSANVIQVVDAVNSSLRSTNSSEDAFELTEALQILTLMNERNEIMYACPRPLMASVFSNTSL
jgi:DNA replication licensing factor MCM3